MVKLHLPWSRQSEEENDNKGHTPGEESPGSSDDIATQRQVLSRTLAEGTPDEKRVKEQQLAAKVLTDYFINNGIPFSRQGIQVTTRAKGADCVYYGVTVHDPVTGERNTWEVILKRNREGGIDFGVAPGIVLIG